MKKIINTIGIGSILWVLVDIALPFIPFGGLAFSIALLYVFYVFLSNSLFKDAKRTDSKELISERSALVNREKADQSIRKVTERINELNLDI